jgi:hypothetical protein
MKHRVARLGVVVGVVAAAAVVSAQRGGGPSPQQTAPIDLTGYWVSIVNEDWRWRMVTPPKGDVASVPINAEGRKIAESWDPKLDGSCLAYGAAGLMRMPTRRVWRRWWWVWRRTRRCGRAAWSASGTWRRSSR